ncbi:hypothetical protein [Pseudobacteriovorax antillogorgiicola]|uniref:F5/8 type C domain-containing protein n=1 Tax=Pseudobacteriovorax antillogorgiicola TaxID=1513793 RepID=A0A1Y6CLC0_9BACT|nr:hypothetical protein [Pseudobacteriovorax antillogorgiicola]TCS47588.1 hypothetical protein EDD56_12029 [Pseudobacteriovorax antillogorgiicola]SMF60262.1 hypothetical protein SAMN06296036_120111 [Pseudobacteriovorax antillogorgiicola]
MLRRFGIVTIFLFSASCSESSEPISKRDSYDTPSVQVAESPANSTSQALVLSHEGRDISFELDTAIDPETVDAYIMGAAEYFSASHSSGGRYEIINVPLGNQILHIKANRSDGVAVGAVRDIFVSGAKGSHLGAVDLEPLGALQGRYKGLTSDETYIKFVGLDQGTYRLDDNGNFYILDLAPGDYRVQVVDGDYRHDTRLTVEPDTTVQLGTNNLNGSYWSSETETYTRYRLAVEKLAGSASYAAIAYLQLAIDNTWQDAFFISSSGYIGNHSVYVTSSAAAAGFDGWKAFSDTSFSTRWQSSSGLFSSEGDLAVDEAPYLEFSFFTAVALDGIRIVGSAGEDSEISPTSISIRGSHDGVNWFSVGPSTIEVDTDTGAQISL